MSGWAPETASAGSGFPRPPLAAAVNHLLSGASWARDRLKPFSGKTVRFNVTPFSSTLLILDSGVVADSGAGAPDAEFTLSPGIGLRMLVTDSNAWREVKVDGDTALAREVLFIAQNLRWDIEEDLSRVVGDIAAHRLVQAIDKFRSWPLQAGDNLARAAAAYWTEEQPLIATRSDVENFLRLVDTLRDDVARIEQRIEHLVRKGR